MSMSVSVPSVGGVMKVVKLLGSLVPEEPRLARKLLEPLATIIQVCAAVVSFRFVLVVVAVGLIVP